MSVANLTRYKLMKLINDAIMHPWGNDDVVEYVKFEEAMEASSNSLQQLKAEICEHANSYIKECQYEGLERLVVKNFSRWLVRKLSAV